MTQYIEDYLPPLRDSGLNTLEDTSLGGALTVTGATTFSGSVVGGKNNVVDATSATTLTAAQSGSVVMFDSTTGFQIKLPTPVAGLNYKFVMPKTPISGTSGIYTNSASVFLLGGVMSAQVSGATIPNFFATNGAAHTALGMNGTTTGGTIGTVFNVVAVNTTQWSIDGTFTGSGVLATPFLV